MYTNLELISNIIECSYDKRYNKIDSYKEMLELLNNDIYKYKNELFIKHNDIQSNSIQSTKDNEIFALNNIIFSKAIDLQYITFNQIANENKKIIQITLEYDNNEINSNYTRFNLNEYESLNNTFIEYAKTNKKRLNKSYLINLYILLKMTINIKNNVNSDLDISIKYLSKKSNISEKTVEGYLAILENYGIIKIIKGNYNSKIANKYQLLLD